MIYIAANSVRLPFGYTCVTRTKLFRRQLGDKILAMFPPRHGLTLPRFDHLSRHQVFEQRFNPRDGSFTRSLIFAPHFCDRYLGCDLPASHRCFSSRSEDLLRRDQDLDIDDILRAPRFSLIPLENEAQTGTYTQFWLWFSRGGDATITKTQERSCLQSDILDELFFSESFADPDQLASDIKAAKAAYGYPVKDVISERGMVTADLESPLHFELRDDRLNVLCQAFETICGQDFSRELVCTKWQSYERLSSSIQNTDDGKTIYRDRAESVYLTLSTT